MPVPVFTAGEVLTAANMNQVGLWLVKTQTIGSAVSSVTVTGAFSADYDNYKIIVSGGTASTNVLIQFYLGSSAPANGYYGAVSKSTYAGVSAGITGMNNLGLIERIGYGTSNSIQANLELINPFNTVNTTFFSNFASHVSGGDTGTVGGFVNDSASYTSFTIKPNTGTLSGGTICVYGYRN